MVAQTNIEVEEAQEPPERIVLSPRDAEAILKAMERPAIVNPRTVEQLKKDRLFGERYGVESVR
jgi:hypothetical protein